MNTFPLHILRINETVFNGDAVSVTVPGSQGEMTILKSHETLITSLKPGLITINQDGKSDTTNETVDVTHGFVEATHEKVTILL